MNTLRKKTNLLIYLLRLLQDTFNKIISFSCLAIHFRQKELISFKFIYLLTQNSRAKLIP